MYIRWGMHRKRIPEFLNYWVITAHENIQKHSQQRFSMEKLYLKTPCLKNSFYSQKVVFVTSAS